MREKFKTLKDKFKDKISNLFHKLNSVQKDYYTKTLPKACKDVFTLGSSKSYPMTLNFKPPKQKSQTSLVFGMNATNL
ncbi:hypothetical protein [Helicobacter pylori]|uniref:hypothetical protein n=1 Tax=Helicobacter pylori TaxID=210 RepID=UPI001EE95C60|nr:hypothetical protein [Helicobacter pylori]